MYIFKKAANMPIIINFTHSVSKSRDYYGCPRVVATCQELGFNSTVVGYGYDMIGALMSEFINSECTQYVVEYAHVVNESRGGYNPIWFNSKTCVFYVNFCTCDLVSFFEDVGLCIKLTYKRSGKLSSVVISNK